nr:hypothetical protein [Tanacetum cinerariifolium]
MNTTQAQQKALDDALVALANCIEFRKGNMRLKTDTVSVHKSSIRFTINKKKVSFDVDTFREILHIFPKVPGQRFEDLPLEHEILSFIRDLGHTRDIHYLTDVIIDYLHQQWRAFATIINKCLSGKDTAYEKIRLSRAQILWDTSPKKKPDQATKGTRLKSSARLAKSNKQKQPAKIPNTKGLDVLTEVALTKAEQIKLTTKRSKKDFHMSHASGSGDGVDTHQDEDDADEETDKNDDNDEEEEEEKADDEEVSFDQRVSTPPEYELTEEEENKERDDEDIEGKQEQDKEDDLYRDVNINLERSDAEMTNAQANQDTEDTHVTVTTVPPVVQQ